MKIRLQADFLMETDRDGGRVKTTRPYGLRRTIGHTAKL